MAISAMATAQTSPPSSPAGAAAPEPQGAAQPAPAAAPALAAGQPPVVQYQDPQGAAPPPPNGAYAQPGYAPPNGAYAQPNAIYEPPAPAAKPSDHLHDGFYLRLAIGGGYMSNAITFKSSVLGSSEVKVTGGALAMEILLGGAVIPGLVLGAGLWADPMLSPTLKTAGGSASISEDLNVQLSRLGAFVDFYPDPKDGFHVQGNVAYTSFAIRDKSTNITLANAKGLGLGASVGYEWWIGKQWGAGVMGRFVYASLSADEESHSVIYPSLLSTFTFN